MHIAIVTAGGAGMFCGSCMHDNTWARALIRAGCEVSLVPTYTPIRVDEPDQSERKVFYGGLNVYLRSKLRWWGRLPSWGTGWLDSQRVIHWATKLSVSNDASKLGQLTLDMLAGEEGPHRAAGEELAKHLAGDLKPDVVIFSNALLSGAVRQLRDRFSGPILCTLQGDDVFLDGLPSSFKSQAIAVISRRAGSFDAFFVHSRFYRDYISGYLRLPVERFRLLPLGIDLTGHDGRAGERSGHPFTVGYFARIAPEKGLHRLVAAFALLHRELPEARLRVGGYLADGQRGYFREIQRAAQPFRDNFEYIGSPATHEEKVKFLRSLDVLSAPTEFLEPKGLYVLEALANGVPVVQPAHGAFPELIEATGGGRLVEPGDAAGLAAALRELADNPEERIALGTAGRESVHARFHSDALARATVEALEEHLKQPVRLQPAGR